MPKRLPLGILQVLQVSFRFPSTVVQLFLTVLLGYKNQKFSVNMFQLLNTVFSPQIIIRQLYVKSLSIEEWCREEVHIWLVGCLYPPSVSPQDTQGRVGPDSFAYCHTKLEDAGKSCSHPASDNWPADSQQH